MQEYIQKLEKENRELVKELEKVHELEEKLAGWETACFKYKQQIENLNILNNNQARMIARLEQQCGMMPYNPMGTFGDKYASNYKAKLIEQVVREKMCELPKMVVIRNGE